MKSKPFQLSRRKIGRKIEPRYGQKIKTFIRDEFPEIKPIQGIMPDSKEEYWVSLALDLLKIEYIFQYSVLGGRGIRGGQIIDFWVKTVPLPTPLYVQGMYWHYGTAARAQRSRMNIELLKRVMRGQILEPVEIFDTECPDPDVTYNVVKRKLKQ